MNHHAQGSFGCAYTVPWPMRQSPICPKKNMDYFAEKAQVVQRNIVGVEAHNHVQDKDMVHAYVLRGYGPL